MCGIAGFLSPATFRNEPAKSTIEGMISRLAHRGPDDQGTWIDGAVGIALGHRRLSILDVSSAGHQPMISASGRYVLVFNVEIFFRTHSPNTNNI